MMLTARSFAAKNHYDVDADREFAALGVANIASALSQGFAISGGDSRKAMNDAVESVPRWLVSWPSWRSRRSWCS
jgi:MFS superfamily sulfate permease-like transporter